MCAGCCIGRRCTSARLLAGPPRFVAKAGGVPAAFPSSTDLRAVPADVVLAALWIGGRREWRVLAAAGGVAALGFSGTEAALAPAAGC